MNNNRVGQSNPLQLRIGTDVMKQDIVLVCRKTEHTIHVCDFLRDHHIDSAIIEDAVDLWAGLSSCKIGRAHV